MTYEDGADGLAVRLGGRQERRRRNPGAEAAQGAGGFQGREPVALGVKRIQVGDGGLEARAGRDLQPAISTRLSALRGQQKLQALHLLTRIADCWLLCACINRRRA